MSDVVIDISGVGKRYALTHQHRPDSLKVWLRDMVKRRLKLGTNTATDEDFWALKDVSLEVKQGDCLALIGKNGSGKSTLLKILSRIIPPTRGQIRLRGRVASLLEVGTGFHPELTGRENVFLNGAMLGCSEKLIRQRFDAIVDFSGVERFLDTPVKHYSSGMYVRLAYAVAAHVNAEILVIDEVLAVGDAQFQEKCLNHIGSSLDSGTTVIMVSHNIPAIYAIASDVAWLQDGQLIDYSPIGSGILEHFKQA